MVLQRFCSEKQNNFYGSQKLHLKVIDSVTYVFTFLAVGFLSFDREGKNLQRIFLATYLLQNFFFRHF